MYATYKLVETIRQEVKSRGDEYRTTDFVSKNLFLFICFFLKHGRHPANRCEMVRIFLNLLRFIDFPILAFFKKRVTDGRTERRTDGRTNPPIEFHLANQLKKAQSPRRDFLRRKDAKGRRRSFDESFDKGGRELQSLQQHQQQQISSSRKISSSMKVLQK